jgi:hypothetical protein
MAAAGTPALCDAAVPAVAAVALGHGSVAAALLLVAAGLLVSADCPAQALMLLLPMLPYCAGLMRKSMGASWSCWARA